MTAQALARRPALRFGARQYRRLRAAHPVTVLRWLRNGVLLCVAAAAAVSLAVALQASHDIRTARSTRQAVAEIGNARTATTNAGNDLHKAMASEDPTLTGTGSAYVDQVTQVIGDLTVVAGDNAAATAGSREIQYVENLLASYLEQSEAAVTDYTFDPPPTPTGGSRLGNAGEAYAKVAEQSLSAELKSLRTTEQSALAAQRGTWSLDPGPGGFWWTLATPVFVMLLLAVATARVLARRFRRLVSGWLVGAWTVTAATAAVVGYLNANDAASLPADPWAGRPATLTCAMLLFAVAAVFAYRAYRPRLAEYLFRPAGQQGEGAP